MSLGTMDSLTTLPNPRNQRPNMKIFLTFCNLSSPQLTSPFPTGSKIQVSLFLPGGRKPEISLSHAFSSLQQFAPYFPGTSHLYF